MKYITEKECLLKQLAMAVDTDGNIGIRAGERGYSQIIQVTNTNIRLIQWLVYNFGGKIPNPTDMGENHKDVYFWYLTGYNSYKLIKKIRSYLLLKQEQADLAIGLWERVTKWRTGNKKMPSYKKEIQEELYERCRELNKRGKPNEKSESPKLIRKVITLEEYV